MMEQLLIHLWGDYLTQSHWMAENKTRWWFPAFCHAAIYSLPFFLIGHWPAIAAIFITHYFIDRYRLARYVIWAKNHLAPKRDGYFMLGLGREWKGRTRFAPWKYCSKTGYMPSVPDWLAVWLLIIADNALHLTCNYLALRFM